jgi:hypothetical protein
LVVASKQGARCGVGSDWLLLVVVVEFMWEMGITIDYEVRHGKSRMVNSPQCHSFLSKDKLNGYEVGF